MIRILLLLLFFALTSTSFAQSMKGSNERKSGSFFSRLFHVGQKPRAQMSHFDKKGKDPIQKDNGTLYIRSRKSKLTVDGGGYSIPKQRATSKRERGRIRKQNSR